MTKKEEILIALKEVLTEDMKINHIGIDEEESVVTIIVKTPHAMEAKEEKAFTRQVAKIVKVDHKYGGLKLEIEKPHAGAPKQAEIGKSTKYITVTSGKGGVGKSTVAGNLAVALARLGKKVGIMDADIYGPSLPNLFNLVNPQLGMDENQKMIPVQTPDGVYMISTEFLTEDDQPLMWRGPMLGRMLGHFFNDVNWDEDMDYLIVDLPPGTGDVPLDVKTFIPEAKAIVVTTPNKMASHIAIKSGQMAQHLGHELLGVVENMSYFTNPVNGAEEKIFGAGGGDVVAEKLKTEVLAQIPIAQVKDGYDSGIFAIHEENGLAYLGLANKVMKHFEK